MELQVKFEALSLRKFYHIAAAYLKQQINAFSGKRVNSVQADDNFFVDYLLDTQNWHQIIRFL